MGGGGFLGTGLGKSGPIGALIGGGLGGSIGTIADPKFGKVVNGAPAGKDIKGAFGGGKASKDVYSNDYNINQNLIRDSQYLTDEQKAQWSTDFQNEYLGSTATHPLGYTYIDGSAAVSKFSQKLNDLSREVETRRVYVQEQFNAANNAVNSKLQQTRITSFLGTTAARAAL